MTRVSRSADHTGVFRRQLRIIRRIFGIGIDENTAVTLKKYLLEVVSEGAVTILDASGMNYMNMLSAKDGEILTMADIKNSRFAEKAPF